MATKYKLTWKDEQGGRWRKRYKKKSYYFPRFDTETKEQSYYRCWQEWLKKKSQIDSVSPETEPWRVKLSGMIAETKSELLSVQQEDTPENRERWMELIDQLREYELVLARNENPFDDVDDDGTPINYNIGNPDDHPDDDLPPWAIAAYSPFSGIPSPANPEFYTLVAKPTETIDKKIKAYLQEKEVEAKSGDISLKRVDVIRLHLEHFAKSVGPSLPVERISSALIVSFRNELKGKVADKNLSPSSARDKLQAMKQFVKWCWVHESLPSLPRVLDAKSQQLRITVPQKEIEIFSDEEVKTLLAETEEVEKLYTLLCLNCGFTTVDLSDLLHTEVDWNSGRIDRKRSKTKDTDDVPVVSYKLWPETFALLKKHRSKHPDRVLTNPKGKPLKVETIANAKVKTVDSVRAVWLRIERRTGITKPMKLLRKTASTKLGSHPTYSRFAQHFLGHSPGTMADKHYVQPSKPEFDKAVEWLGKQFLPATKPKKR